MSLGIYNVGTATDSILEIGDGVNGARKNVFEVFKDSTGTLPVSTPVGINARGIKSLVTIEYLFSAEFGNSLPTTNPNSQGKLWNNSGVVSVSAGSPP